MNEIKGKTMSKRINISDLELYKKVRIVTDEEDILSGIVTNIHSLGFNIEDEDRNNYPIDYSILKSLIIED